MRTAASILVLGSATFVAMGCASKGEAIGPGDSHPVSSSSGSTAYVGGNDGASSAVDAGVGAASDSGGLELGDGNFVEDAQTGEGGEETCNLGSAGSFATQDSLNLFGQIVYYENGQVLPAGRYRVTYVDGCMKYASYEDWAVQAIPPADAFWLVGDTSSNQVVMPPGTVGYMVGSGGYATFDECVAANLLLPPIEFNFAGGKLGVWLSDNPYTDNVAGTDGRNPKWSLTLLGQCPVLQ